MTSKIQISNDLPEILRQLSQLMPGGIFCYDADENQEFVFISDSMPGIFGYTKEEFLDKFNNRFPDMVYVEDRERVLQEITDQTRDGNSDYCMYRVETADGTLKWIFDRGRLITDENGKRWFYVVIVDADELKAAEQRRTEYEKQLLNELRSQAQYDITTGLLNRSTAVTRIKMALEKCPGGTLLLLDIGNSGVSGSTSNAHYANHHLKDIAFSIRQLVHPEETLGYFGENKFIIFLPGCFNHTIAQKRAEEICEAVREIIEYDIGKGKCNIGIAVSDNKETTFEKLLKEADSALNRARKG